MHERLDHAEHLRDEVGRTWFEIRAGYAERIEVVIHGLDESTCQRLDRLAVFHCAANDLVVDVCDVAHVSHVESERAKPALDNIEHDHHACVPDMTIVIHCDSTNIHAHFSGTERHERLLVTRERVVDAQ